jgi:Fic family protein
MKVCLRKVRKVRTEGAWEDWIRFFLTGVSETSQEAANTAREIIKLKDNLITRLYENYVEIIARGTKD